MSTANSLSPAQYFVLEHIAGLHTQYIFFIMFIRCNPASSSAWTHTCPVDVLRASFVVQVAKYVDAQAPALLGDAPKSLALRSLAEQLYIRRPVLYLKNHPEPLPATVLLRTARKPSVGALSTVSAAGLFKSPDNSFIIIKFDPQFGYAGMVRTQQVTTAALPGISQQHTTSQSQFIGKQPI